MAECTKTYLTALVNPWAVKSPPCVPDAITLPSYKAGYYVRGRFTAGTLGDGFVTLDPYAMVAGNGDAVYYTGDAYPATGINYSAGGVASVSSNSPYTAAQFQGAGPMRFRLVACGLKARYMGSEFQRAGRMIEYRTPTNNSVPESQFSDLLANRETTSAINDRKFHYVIWRPALPSDLAYGTLPDVPYQAQCVVLGVEGAQPGTSFEYDIMAHFEIIGDKTANLSVSHSDPHGMSLASSALATHQPALPPEEQGLTVAHAVMQAATSGTTTISKGGGGDTVGGLASLFSGAEKLLNIM